VTADRDLGDRDWRALNRANWDERVGVHLGSPDYDLAPLRAGRGKLNPIEEAELGEVRDLEVLHLQCHFGADTLCLAQRGARVTGLDFSRPAIAEAGNLADELGLADRARFVCADLYDAPAAIGRPAAFDLVYVTWGTTVWLPDIRRWADVVAHFLKPGGRLYYADDHPAALVFDNETKLPDGRPGYFMPYLEGKPLITDDGLDYADPEARLANATNVSWLHPVSSLVGGLIDAGLSLDWLHEHAQLPWQMFQVLVKREDGDWHWPDKRWLPLALSLQATKR
jgi:SAM-dependent methyltransferase